MALVTVASSQGSRGRGAVDKGSYRRRSVRVSRDHVRMRARHLRLVSEDDLLVIPPGCWPAQDEEVDEDAELRVLAQGTGEHLPHELRLRVLELRACRARPWPGQAA